LKAPIAQAAAEAASAPGCAFLFFWGLENLKYIKKIFDFGWVGISAEQYCASVY
jgi:hypothetical protein